MLRFRNDDGRYGGIGSGSYAAIRKGSEIAISPGYYTSAGVEVSSGLAYWIKGWQHASKGGTASFVLEAENGWSLLDAWKARRQFKWSAGQKNIFQLLAFILARAGLELTTISSSSTLSNHYPAFAIYPSESGAQAVHRLLEMVPDVLFSAVAAAILRILRQAIPAATAMEQGMRCWRVYSPIRRSSPTGCRSMAQA